jgi:hypothetical protein
VPVPARRPARSREEAFQPQAVKREAWIHLGIGFAVAAVSFFFWLPRTVLSGLQTLIHEMGHAFFGWVFGRPSIPAFDLQYGGGITLIPDQSAKLLVLVYLALAFAAYYLRRNRVALVVLACFTAVYALCAHTGANESIILWMGHGAELLIAGVFLYRAISDRSIVNPLERPLYAVCGWFIVLHDVGFGYKLLTDRVERALYEMGKGGTPNDFVVLAREHFHVSMDAVVVVFLLCCALPVALAFLAYWYQPWMWGVLGGLMAPGAAEEDGGA